MGVLLLLAGVEPRVCIMLRMSVDSGPGTGGTLRKGRSTCERQRRTAGTRADTRPSTGGKGTRRCAAATCVDPVPTSRGTVRCTEVNQVRRLSFCSSREASLKRDLLLFPSRTDSFAKKLSIAVFFTQSKRRLLLIKFRRSKQIFFPPLFNWLFYR